MVVAEVVVEVAAEVDGAAVGVVAMTSPAVVDTRVSSALVMRRASVSQLRSYQTSSIKPLSASV